MQFATLEIERVFVEAFPVGGPPASVSEVLKRLEAIIPGFVTWSQNLGGQGLHSRATTGFDVR